MGAGHSLSNNTSRGNNNTPVKVHSNHDIKNVKNDNTIHHPGVKVELNIEFKFKSHLYESASNLFMSQVAPSMIKAFKKRAEQLHDTNLKP